MRRSGILLLALAVCGAAGPKDAEQIDTLLGQLRAAPDERAAASVEGKLRGLWRHAGSPASVMLLDRAARETQSGSADAAIEDADAVLALDPDYVEAFVVRATARLAAGDSVGALRDAAEALRREPRNIDGLMLLSRAAEQRGDAKAAFGSWQTLLDLDPKTPDGAARLRDLRRRAVGEDI